MLAWVVTHQESWSHWESGIGQNEDGCSLSWSSVCLNFPRVQTKASAFLLAHTISLGRETSQWGRYRDKPHTLNTADTVWKEEPFFFPPFLLPAESPAEWHRAGVRSSTEGPEKGLGVSQPCLATGVLAALAQGVKVSLDCSQHTPKLPRFGDTQL